MTRISCLLLVALVACDGDEETKAKAPAAAASTALLEAAEEQAPSAAPEQKHGAAQKAGERVAIPAGKLVAGSTPGDRGRDPTLEPALLEVELPAFEIDKLPYPNDPRKPPVTGVPRARAAELCASAGGRLCNELEWELACKGPDGQPYAGARSWEPSCAKNPETCASAFGVLAMGAAMREWTSSDVEPIKSYRTNAAAAVRGAEAGASDVDHRCARRMAIDAASSSADLGFRCCYGDAPSATIPSPQWSATAQKFDLPAERLAELLASNPKLAPFSKDVKYFREESAIDTVRRHAGADAGAPQPAETLTTAPLAWNPVPGEEIIVATGQSAGERSFVVAFHRLPGDRYRVAAAMLMEDEPGPIVLVYNPNVRKKLGWATCWECFGEAGNIVYRNENRVVITQGLQK